MSEFQSLDNFLQTQTKAGNLATIEQIEGKVDHVKVTPWITGFGCLCYRAIEVPKSSIESVRCTGDRHTCCGKVFDVVEVHWAKDSLMPLNELFSQMASMPPIDEGRRIGGGDFKPQPQPWRQWRGDPFDSECVAECTQDCDSDFPNGGAGYWRCLRICDRKCRRW